MWRANSFFSSSVPLLSSAAAAAAHMDFVSWRRAGCLPVGGLIAHSCKNWWCGDGGREEKLSCTTHCVSRVLFRGVAAAIARWRLQTMTVHLLIRAALITASHTHQSVAAPQIFTFPAARAIANTRRGAAACVRAPRRGAAFAASVNNPPSRLRY